MLPKILSQINLYRIHPPSSSEKAIGYPARICLFIVTNGSTRDVAANVFWANITHCFFLSIADFEQVNVRWIWSFNLYKITNHTSTVYFKTDRHDDPFDSKRWSFTCHPALKQTTLNLINSKNNFIQKKNRKHNGCWCSPMVIEEKPINTINVCEMSSANKFAKCLLHE